MGENLQSALDMLGDFGNLDADGMKEFNRVFEENLKLPRDALTEVSNTLKGIGTITIGYIYGPIFLILTIFIWIAVLGGFIGWMTGIFLTALLGVILVISSMLYASNVSRYVSASSDRINSHIGAYTEDFAGNLTSTFGQAAGEYSKVTRAKKPVVQPTQTKTKRRPILD